MTHFSIPPPNEAQFPEGVPKHWCYIPMTAEQNAAFYDLLKRYAPLFPQKSDEAPEKWAAVEPVFVEGERRCTYPMPRPDARPLMQTPYNEYLVFDADNTNRDQESDVPPGRDRTGRRGGDNEPSDDDATYQR